MSANDSGHGFTRGRPSPAPSANPAQPDPPAQLLVVEDDIWRRIFAGLALQAIVQGVAPSLAGTTNALEETPTAEAAVRFADALIAALNRPPEKGE